MPSSPGILQAAQALFVTSDISRNTMGKIQKKDLRETYKGTLASR